MERRNKTRELFGQPSESYKVPPKEINRILIKKEKTKINLRVKGVHKDSSLYETRASTEKPRGKRSLTGGIGDIKGDWGLGWGVKLDL